MIQSPVCSVNSFLVNLLIFILYCSIVDLQCCVSFRCTAKLCICFTGGLSDKESACQYRRCRRHGFNAWGRKIPWRRKWQPTPVFLWESQWGHKESNMTKYTVITISPYIYIFFFRLFSQIGYYRVLSRVL